MSEQQNAHPLGRFHASHAGWLFVYRHDIQTRLICYISPSANFVLKNGEAAGACNPFLEGRARIVCAGGGITVLPSSAIMQIEDGFVSTQSAYSGVKKLRDKDMGFHGRIRAFCLRLNVNIST
jgi:hypothetical protein